MKCGLTLITIVKVTLFKHGMHGALSILLRVLFSSQLNERRALLQEPLDVALPRFQDSPDTDTGQLVEWEG